MSLFSSDLVHTSTSGGRCGLGDEDLRGWLATVVVVVASGTWWSVLDLMLVLGTRTRVVSRLATIVAHSKDSVGAGLFGGAGWNGAGGRGATKDGLCGLLWWNMLLGIQILRF